MGRSVPPLQKIIVRPTSPPPPKKREHIENKAEEPSPKKSSDVMDYLLPVVLLGSLFGGDE